MAFALRHSHCASFIVLMHVKCSNVAFPWHSLRIPLAFPSYWWCSVICLFAWKCLRSFETFETFQTLQTLQNASNGRSGPTSDTHNKRTFGSVPSPLQTEIDMYPRNLRLEWRRDGIKTDATQTPSTRHVRTSIVLTY